MNNFSRGAAALLLLMGACALPMAHADVMNPSVGGASDFKMHVLDPTYEPAGTPHYITGLNFQITFTPCVANELPNGMTADGCFLGFNRSAVNWTSLQFVFQNNGTLLGQTPDCSPAPTDNIFTRTSCAYDGANQSDPNGKYNLLFGAGVIPNAGSESTFFITEDGVDPSFFGIGQATVTSYTSGTYSPTPEPSTWILLASGLAIVGAAKLQRLA